MTPYHDTRASRLHEGPTVLTNWEAASIAGAVSGIQAIAGLLVQHCADAECDGDDLLRLNGASVGGLLEAVNGMAELIELRLGYGTSRAQQTPVQGGGA
jgi:hypothetical protein